MRKIAFVVGVVGAAAVLLRRLQEQINPVPAYTGKPLEPHSQQALPFDNLLERPAAQVATAEDDLPLPFESVVVNHNGEEPVVTEEAAVLDEPLLQFAQMPVDDVLLVKPENETGDLSPLSDDQNEAEAPYTIIPEIEAREELEFTPQNVTVLEIDNEIEAPYVVIPQIDENDMPENDAERFADELEIPEPEIEQFDSPFKNQNESPERVPKWTPDVLAKEMFHGDVIYLHSADTFEVKRNDTGETVQFRLWGVNADKPSQPMGQEAMQFAQMFIDNKVLSFEVRASFRDGQRLVGWLIADGESLNIELLESGLARWYSELFPNETLLAEAETKARDEQRGLWA